MPRLIYWCMCTETSHLYVLCTPSNVLQIKCPCKLCIQERFTFERIRNTKEQSYFYKRAKNHQAKEWMFKSFSGANFPGKHLDAGVDQ